MIQGTLSHTLVLRSPCYVQASCTRHSPGGIGPDAGRAPTRAVWLPLALHILLLYAAGHCPAEIAGVLFCSRSSVYRAVRANRKGTLGLKLDDHRQLSPPVRARVLTFTLRWSLLTLLKATPQACGWCPYALELCDAGPDVASQTGPHSLGGDDAPLAPRDRLGLEARQAVAKDDDPQRVSRLTRIRWVFEQLKPWKAMVFADELDMRLLPKVGCAWMPRGTELAIMTPGQNQKHYLAGALDLATGTLLHCLGVRKTNALCRDLLQVLEASCPAEQYTQLYVVVDNYRIRKVKAVEQWLANHPRSPLTNRRVRLPMIAKVRWLSTPCVRPILTPMASYRLWSYSIQLSLCAIA
jgi:Homeodomain-like domain